MIAFITIYLLLFIGLLLAANKHGQPRDENYNFWFTLINTLMWLILVWWATGWRFI